ncbi:MAG: VTT domain-containing protein [Myxococcota bacterium]
MTSSTRISSTRSLAFELGRNCWRVESATRVKLLVDGAAYFRAFREAAKRARHSLLILGWDIDSRFELARDASEDGLPTRLGEFLGALLVRNADLRISLLDWSFPRLYGMDREWLPTLQPVWNAHPRLRFRLDDRHPVGASHHQKIVVVDDRVAFAGGLDFALGRWDTPEHAPDDERRREPDNGIRQPYHDLMMMVDGDVAAALGELARSRWTRATDETLASPLEEGPADDPWPPGLAPDLEHVPVAIARTTPEFDGERGVHEIEHLLLDAIRSARDALYIEAQYLTSERIGEALEARLEERGGPEVVVVMPRHSVGWLSHNTMDVLRVRLIQRLVRADRDGRLRVCSPEIDGLGEQCVNVHSKLLIADDRFLRVGSANLSNRSMGFDTECDLALLADGDGGTDGDGDGEDRDRDERIRRVIGALRARLLAEHLGAEPFEIESALDRGESMIGVIETRGRGPRRLAPLELALPPGLEARVPDGEFIDPARPFDVDGVAEELLPAAERSEATRSLVMLGLALLAAVSLALVWRMTPLGERWDVAELLARMSAARGAWTVPLAVSSFYVVAGFLAVPITLLIVATGLVFGAWQGFAYALLGAEVSALAAYAVGRWLGRRGIERVSERWIGRISRRIARQGFLAVVTLRFVPIAPYTVVNLMAGASHIRFRDFALGTLIGLAPGTLLLTVFAGQLETTLGSPTAMRVALLLMIGLAGAVGLGLLGRWLLGRRDEQKR